MGAANDKITPRASTQRRPCAAMASFGPFIDTHLDLMINFSIRYFGLPQTIDRCSKKHGEHAGSTVQIVQGARYPVTPLFEDMGIDHGGGYIAMAQKRLNGADIIAAL